MNYIEYLKKGNKAKQTKFTLDEIDALNRSMRIMWNVLKTFDAGNTALEGVPTPTVSNRKSEDGHVSSDFQDTYLVPRELQDKYLKSLGYISTPRDYGLVKKAVGNRKLPVYLQLKDVISRDPLVVIGNPNTDWMGEDETDLQDSGHTPSALYVDGLTGNLYLKSWDLNDYGNIHGGGYEYGPLGNVLANLGDLIGNPTVITTGYLPVLNWKFNVNNDDLLNGEVDIDWEATSNILDPSNYKEENGKYIPYNIYLKKYLTKNNMHVEKGDDGKLILVNTPNIVVTNKKSNGGILNYLNY